ncbi:MAG: L,D-transpeptidase family protein [Deltaproteobacteria bacterium]|nr:L,D-transpeptidase family protein [Deltaproteobacteria bacterium]
MRTLRSGFAAILFLGTLHIGFARPACGAEEAINPADDVPAPTAVMVSPLRISINIPARELTLFENDRVVAQYPVAIGAPAYKSIVMDDQITRIEWNPWWYPPPSPWAAGASVTPPGPGNPLGPVKLPLGQGIRIHGTNKESSVGTAASHGCFRMRNRDATALAWYLQTRLTMQSDPALLEKYRRNRGSTFIVNLDQSVPVNVIYATAVVQDGVLHLYRDVYRKVRDWFTPVTTALEQSGIRTDQLPPERLNELRQQLRKGDLHIPIHELLEAPMAAYAPVAETAAIPSR